MNDLELPPIQSYWQAKIQHDEAVAYVAHELRQAHKAEIESICNTVQSIMENAQDVIDWMMTEMDCMGSDPSTDEALNKARTILLKSIHILKSH